MENITIMENIKSPAALPVVVERLVHVVPLGWELDRAILPIRAMRGHRAYLLTNPESHPNQAHFYQLVARELERMAVEVVSVRVDAHSDLEGLVQEIGRIIKREVAAGNRVYVNASASGKIAAIAATIAGMAHLGKDGLVYYVRPKEYILTEKERMRHGLTRGMDGDPVDIPLFTIPLPSRVECLVLRALSKKSKEKVATYQELFDLLHAEGIQGYPSVTKDTRRNVKGKLTVNLTKSVLRPLREAGYVTIRVEGKRAIVRLTEQGDYMAQLAAVE